MGLCCSKQCRLFPELAPRLVRPTQLFSVPPVTRVGHDGELPTGRKARVAPAPQVKRPLPVRKPLKRILPKRLLRQVSVVGRGRQCPPNLAHLMLRNQQGLKTCSN